MPGEDESSHIPPQHPLSPERDGSAPSQHRLWPQLSEYSHSSLGAEALTTGCSSWEQSYQKKRTALNAKQSVEEEGRGGQGNAAPVTQWGLESFCCRVEKPRAIPTPSQSSFSWKIYSSELIVWLGTMVRMLPCKLNNSCPLFNLFDLDCSNLLCALGLFFFKKKRGKKAKSTATKPLARCSSFHGALDWDSSG